MINLNEEIDNSVDDFDEDDKRQAYLAFLKIAFHFYYARRYTDEAMTSPY